MDTKLSRRDFLRLAALSAASAALAGCRTPPAEAPQTTQATKEVVAIAPKADPVELDYVANWGDNYTVKVWNALKELPELKEYLGDNTIQVSSVGGDAFATRLAGGTAPDGASNVDYVQYMSRGMLIDVEPWVNTSSVIKPDDHITSVWGNAFYQGKMYGVPANENWVWYGLVYNSKLVEEAGLDPDTPPVTWDETVEWHRTITKFDDAGNMTLLGLDCYDAMANEPDFWALSWGWQWFDESTGSFDLDNKSMIEAINVGAEFYKIAGPDNMVAMRQVEGQGQWGGSFNAEVQAMLITGYWRPGATMTSKPEVGQYVRVSWAPVPNMRRGAKIQGAGGHYVVFFRESKHAEAMFKIAEFLNTDAACLTIFDQTGWLPSRKSFIQQIDPNTYPGLDFYLVDINETTDWLRSGRRCPIHWFVTSAYGELREAVYRGQMNAEQAAAELQKRAVDEWDAQALN